MDILCRRVSYFAPQLIILLAALLLSAQRSTAQDGPDRPRPDKIKVLDEYSDGKGNIVRVIQYSQGLMRVTETIITPKKPSYNYNYRVPINADTMRKDSVMLVVDKSDYLLQVWYRHRVIRAYKAVFGPHPLENKVMEGDRCTPEGVFKIANKNPGSKYDRFMGLNYPNDSAMIRFNRMKANGSLPANARIGGSVGIHGIWPGGDDMIELGVGWTDGCVALKNRDIEELYTFVTVGTKVVTRK